MLLFERYASPLLTLAATGDAAAAAELSRLGQSGLKPLTETLVEGDATEQRTAIALLGQMKNPSAVPALLSIVTGGASQAGKPGVGKEDSADGRVVLGTSGPRPADIELRTEALYAAAQLADPSSLKTPGRPLPEPREAAAPGWPVWPDSPGRQARAVRSPAAGASARL